MTTPKPTWPDIAGQLNVENGGYETPGSELEPCPFCGTTLLRVIKTYSPESPRGHAYRVCHNHDLTGFHCAVAGSVRNTQGGAIAAWNTRAALKGGEHG